MEPVTTADNEGFVQPTLLVLQGLPASGKTTHARELVEQGNWVRVNKDDLRKMMDSGKHSNSNEKRVLRVRDQIIIDALAHGKNVVVDDTNFANYHLERFQELAQKHDAHLHFRFFDTDVEECIRRNAQRGEDGVPSSAIWEMYQKYVKPAKEAAAENEVQTEPTDELPEAIIVDVDGTLAHIDSNNPRNVYDASRAHEDILDDAVGNIVGMAYQNGYHVIILSGRKRAHQDVTEKWLAVNGINYDEIHLRMDDDNRKDTIVKKEMYQAFVEGKYQVKYVIDDRPSVCRMWRELGLKVLQVGDPHVEF